MRIARVSIGFPPRRCGWSNHAAALSQEQALLGHEVTVYQPFPNPETPDRVRAVSIVSRRLLRRWGSGLGRLTFALGAARAIMRSRGGPDLLHVHGDIIEAAVLWLVARWRRIPLVVTLHSRLNRGIAYRIVAPTIWRRVDGIIGTSEDIVSDLAARGVPGTRLRAISSGVYLDRYHPPSAAERSAARKDQQLENRRYVIVSVARLHEVKGHEYLIDAFRELCRRGHDATLLLVGDGEARTGLERRAAGLTGVRFLGELGPNDVHRVLHVADVFVLASVDLPGVIEGTPTAVLEAMACGLPVVTTTSGGAARVVHAEPGVTVVAQRDSLALATALERLATDPELRARAGSANRSRAADRSWAHQAALVTRFYAELVRT